MSEAILFDSVTARLSLPLLFSAQAHKELFHNEALARIDALLHASVLGETSEPPQNPADGDCWLIGPLPSGAWHGRPGALAMRQAGQWLFATPLAGMGVFDLATRQFRVFSDGWQKAPDMQEPSGGQVVDSEARAAIASLIAALRALGIIPSA